MNDTTEVAEVLPWKNALITARDRFVAIAEKDRLVDWQRESMFALQSLEKSDFLRKIADSNPQSLRNAIINVAACGITLNPAAQYAALVPRDGQVCLDIMYRGLIKIATDMGSIRWVQAELVYSGDKFTYKGLTEAPVHEADVFAKDRGAVVGVYCVAKTVDGDFLTDFMPVDEVNAIRDRSDYFKKTSKGPWKDHWGEMAKKTIIKRARKTWPESKVQANNERLAVATEIANVTDGYTEPVHGAITPSGDAWDGESEESQAFLLKIATRVKCYIAGDQIDDAVNYLDDQKLAAEEQVAINTRFDSKERAAMKKYRESLKAKHSA